MQELWDFETQDSIRSDFEENRPLENCALGQRIEQTTFAVRAIHRG
jgi:hypothetical protein